MIQERLIQKLLKLIALRDGANAIESFAEAENAQEKIDTILKENNLTEDDVIRQDVKATNEGIDIISKTFVLTDIAKTEGDWRGSLLNAIAKMNKSRVVMNGREKNAPCTIIGTEFNIEVTWATYNSLVPLIKHNANKAFAEYAKYNPYGDKKNTFIRSYLRGVPTGMTDWFNEELAKNRNQETGLMVMDAIQKHQFETSRYIEQKYGRLGSRKGTRQSSAAGFNRGQTDGYSMGNRGGTSSNKIGM